MYDIDMAVPSFGLGEVYFGLEGGLLFQDGAMGEDWVVGIWENHGCIWE